MKDDFERRNQSIQDFFGEAIDRRLIHIDTKFEHGRDSCRLVNIEGKDKIFFGSCSYLGLETDKRLIEAAKKTVEKYGVQFSASRAFLGLDLYGYAEELFSQLFNAYPLLAPSTTLAHLAVFPALIGANDVIIFDKQAHNSMQMAAQICCRQGTNIKVINHNDMVQLETTILNFKNTSARHIWYMADGIYSMYGDSAPLNQIYALLEKYDNFYAYIDDAHGTSWTGKQGRGYALGTRNIHAKMIVTHSLAKAFGTGGGLIIFPNKDWLNKVRTVGPTMIFSGPIQPAVLGAIIASLNIHLSGEIEQLQESLMKKITYFRKLLANKKIHTASLDETPIIHISLGSIESTYRIVETLFSMGYFVTFTSYPLVPKKNSGIRISLNDHLTMNDIGEFVDALSTTLCAMGSVA